MKLNFAIYIKMFNKETFFPDAPTQAVYLKALVPIHAHSSQFLHSFFPSAISAWNALPSDAASASTLSLFTAAIKQYLISLYPYLLFSGCMLIIALS